MRATSLLFALALAAGLAGCSKPVVPVRGYKPVLLERDQLLVQLHRGQVTLEGEKVNIYRAACEYRPPEQKGCPLLPIGRGTVVETIGNREAVVQLAPGTRIPAGARYELSPAG